MRAARNIGSRLLLFALLVVALVGCSKEEDILPQQQEKMVKYLTSTHQPRLVAKEEVEMGTE